MLAQQGHLAQLVWTASFSQTKNSAKRCAEEKHQTSLQETKQQVERRDLLENSSFLTPDLAGYIKLFDIMSKILF